MVPTGAATDGTPRQPSTQQIAFGRRYPDDDRDYARLWLDELHIWDDIILTETQIQEIYNLYQ